MLCHADTYTPVLIPPTTELFSRGDSRIIEECIDAFLRNTFCKQGENATYHSVLTGKVQHVLQKDHACIRLTKMEAHAEGDPNKV